MADGSSPFRARVLCPLGAPSLIGAPNGHGITAQVPPPACGEVQAPRLLGSPAPNSEEYISSKRFISFLLTSILGVGMGLVAVFRARLSSHGGGRLIIYIPKDLQEKLREYHEKKVELVVHLYRED